MGFYIDMIDVGQGDAFLLTLDNPSSNEAHILIDGGSEEKADALVKHLKSYTPGTIDLVIATHLDNDHIGGLIKAAQNFVIRQFVINAPPGLWDRWKQFKNVMQRHNMFNVTNKRVQSLIKSLETADKLMSVLAAKQIVPTVALAGRGWNCADVTLNVLNPTPERLAAAWNEQKFQKMSEAYSPLATSLGSTLQESEAPSTTEENDSSIVIELVYKGSPYALLTGDAGAAVLKEVSAGKSYTYLKVPHHGSKTGLDDELVAQLKPSSAYIPVGSNDYGHPAIEILDMLRENGTRTFCSQKTPNCRKACKSDGFGTVCHRNDKDARPGWSSINIGDCGNNA